MSIAQSTSKERGRLRNRPRWRPAAADAAGAGAASRPANSACGRPPIEIRWWTPQRANWSAKCGLSGSPDAPPGMTKLAEPGAPRSTTWRYTDRWFTVNGLPARHP
ncbi:MAG TPA: hypothetical protein VHV09_09880 [Trebonia sp.]|nr:hypothetical protein [Trebonia sp.]